MLKGKSSGGRVGKEAELFWQGHIDSRKSSGMSIREYCREKGISQSGFYYWQSKLERRLKEAGGRSRIAHDAGGLDRQSGRRIVGANTTRVERPPLTEFPFVPLKLLDSSDSIREHGIDSSDRGNRLELETPRGYRIKICPDTNFGLLSVLLFTLENQRC